MGYMTYWFCVDDDLYRAVKTGEAPDNLIQDLSAAVPEDIVSRLHAHAPDYIIADGMLAFFHHRRMGTQPEKHGLEMTFALMCAVQVVGTQQGDFSTGAPSHLQWQWNTIFAHDPRFASMTNIMEGGISYAEDFPYISLVGSDEVGSLLQGLLDMTDPNKAALAEEYEGLLEIMTSAKDDGRNVITFTE